jgi:hypothetical protein
MDNVNTLGFSIRTKLKELRLAHRDLDIAISDLLDVPHIDQLRIRRLKKEKLRLKDMIVKIEMGMA